jgi:hypothetical protein
MSICEKEIKIGTDKNEKNISSLYRIEELKNSQN